MAVPGGSCKDKRKTEEMVNNILRKKKNIKKRQKTIHTCYSNFQMVFWEVPVKKKRRRNG